MFVAGLQSETNTFAPWPTGARAFEEGGVRRGADVLRGQGPDHKTAQLWRDLCLRDGHDFTPGLFAWAQPSGPIVQAVYEGLRDEILSELSSQGPFDIVLLFLHGAMVSTACNDCEADLVRRVRDIVGEGAVIGVELDPHCHLTQPLIDAADAVILMKHYPHDDYLERAVELYSLCLAKARGEVRPTSEIFDCRMVGFYPTTQEPMASLVGRFEEIERETGVLSVSFAHGFPWGDTPDTGSRVLVITDRDPSLAARLSKQIGAEIYAARKALLPRFPGVDAALADAVATPGLVVVADTADNAGGGAPGDNTSLLKAMLDRGVPAAALGAIWDPIAAAACADAGVGARLKLRIGGKSGPASAQPLDVEATVRAVRERHDQAGLGNSRTDMGLSVWIEVDGIDVVLNSIRTQVFSPDAFTGLGIDLAAKKIVAVKSSQHFHAGFAPIASKVIRAATHGAIQMDFAALPYVKKIDLNYYPRVDDPLA
ncbi:M81 family metallopeptidase [Phenylobacterium sp.]|uniref:M81 family metallopeptidase n=1 Tax=Phenylobacterium sp. TaxID=1871053 RepID=UPI002E34DD32|nr:M81 family metallopeptidase [Phenylobacterium sp.]HEX4709968.1 M81 family metallopeptidase [Phenylobacterium sp.]